MRAALFAAAVVACRAGAAAPPASSSIPVGAQPVDVAVGDLDGDRRLDLVSADAGDRQISVRLARGRGYRAAPAIRLPMQPHLVALADANRDRRLDLFATGHDDPGVHVYLGDGTGRFARAPGSPFAAHGGSRAHNHGLAVGDLDGDGDADVVTSNQELRSVSVLLADGSGGFAPARGSPIQLGDQPYPLELGDLDQDGSLDIVVPLVGGSAVAVLLNDGAAGFRAAPGSPIATLARPYALVITDLDADGARDVVVAHDDTDMMTVLRGDRRGRLRTGSRFSAGQRPWRMAAADLDGDGDIDVTGGAGDRILFLRGDGSGRLAIGPPILPTGQCWTAVVADLDGDGRPDVIGPDAKRRALRIRRGR